MTTRTETPPQTAMERIVARHRRFAKREQEKADRLRRAGWEDAAAVYERAAARHREEVERLEAKGKE